MAWAQFLAAAAKQLPKLAKHLPKLWPLLLETKNRQRMTEIGRDLASRSPRRRLEGRIELTAALADTVGANAADEEERLLADEWARRARNLKIRLDMPVQGRNERKSHRASIQAQLDGLQSEMNSYLEK